MAYGSRPAANTLPVANSFAQLYGMGVGEGAIWGGGDWALRGEGGVRPLGMVGALTPMEAEGLSRIGGLAAVGEFSLGGRGGELGAYEQGSGVLRHAAGGSQSGLRSTALWGGLSTAHEDARFAFAAMVRPHRALGVRSAHPASAQHHGVAGGVMGEGQREAGVVVESMLPTQ